MMSIAMCLQDGDSSDDVKRLTFEVDGRGTNGVEERLTIILKILLVAWGHKNNTIKWMNNLVLP